MNLKLASVVITLIILLMSSLVLAEQKKTQKENPNRFNRLLLSKDKRTPLLKDDGIHDPENFGIKSLQQPKDALSVLDSGTAGNYVDWVKSLNSKKISPRYDLHDPKAEGFPLDLNIVREVKGTMPDVVYPHKQHTQWLDCSNCHPDIFIPQKGANQISMVEIMLGRKCGVCHGKVAFPVTECKRCHSKAKPLKETEPKQSKQTESTEETAAKKRDI